MKRLLRVAFALLASAVFVGVTATGASANAAGVVVIPAGVANTSALTFPKLPLTGTGTWNLSTAAADCTGTPGSCGSITVGGDLAPVAGLIGPFCGASAGTGQGTALGHNVTVEWLSSIGSAFPVLISGSGHTASLALVQVSPTDPTSCAGSGATSFNVRIVAAVTP